MMKKKNSYFSNFLFFYNYLRYRVLIALLLSIFVGILDGFGLTMFLPLLKTVENPQGFDSKSLGYLSFVLDFFKSLNIEITLLSVLIIMCFFFILKGFFTFFQGYYIVNVQQFFLKKLRIILLDLLNKLKYKDFIKVDVGRIQNSLTVEIERLSNAYKGYFESLKAGVMVLVYMVFAFLLSPKFAILVIVGGGLTNFLYRSIYLKTKQASRKLTVDTNFFQGQAMQYIHNFKYLKATGTIFKFSDKLKNSVNHIENNNKRIGFLSSILAAAREPMLIIVVGVVIFVQVKILGDQMATILVSLLFFYRALTFVMLMQSQWNFFIAISGSMENVSSIIEEFKTKLEDDVESVSFKLKNEIAIENISFSYNDTLLMENISLKINKNDTIAFVGESGSGKTTLINIIAGLLPINNGKIMIDGVNFNEIQKKSFRAKIGYITQEPVIFNDTLFNNVTLWDAKTPENIIRFNKAVSESSLVDFVDSLDEKEEIVLGNNGVNLSGGQKQRISIARELYKDIDILIMDEATSALDSETEKYIQQSIDAIKGKYTILIIAHRLSTIRNVDRVVLMSNGRIEDEASFDKLVEINTKFRKMVDLQEI